MAVPSKLRQRIERILSSGSGELRRPVLRRGNESSVPGLFLIGDLAGAPVIKLAMAQGVEVIDYLSTLPDMREPRSDPGVVDILVVGAGAAGLNAALAAQAKGYACVVLEKGKLANTIENFPEGKWVYSEPDSVPPRGKLWLDGARKEDLIERWHGIVRDNGLDVRTEEPLVELERTDDGGFRVVTPRGELRARKIVLATGQRGSPRKLGVPGEDGRRIYHRLYSPRHYQDQEILVVGGGNSAVEAALVLSERNHVTLSYRRGEFARIFRDNREKIDRAIAEKRVDVIFRSRVTELGDGETKLAVERDGVEESRAIPADYVFVLIGAELPVEFLRGLGIRLEGEWTGHPLRAALLALGALAALWLFGGHAGGSAAALGSLPDGVRYVFGGAAAVALAGLVRTGWRGDRWSWLALSFFTWYSVYGIKLGSGSEFWPYRGWGYGLLSFFDRGWSFWYTVLYTGLMTVFGLKALNRWGLKRRDRFQIWRFASLLSFQWIFFFLIPEFLFQRAVEFQWLPARLAADPTFTEQAWRSYGIVYAWPLFFYTFFDSPATVWVVWGALLSFVIIPVAVLFIGKRYCSWICGCGGLAETFGDRWRHLAPKGRTSIRWERMGLVVLVLAVVITALKLTYDIRHVAYGASQASLNFYRLVVDIWLVGILPVTLYPFLGGKVWCRYWCPLAKFMEKLSWLYAKLGVSRFRITANNKCIGCNECTRNCQVGIDVMQYALKQEKLDNETSSCIGCGICVTVCPMDTLKFGDQEEAADAVPGPASGPAANPAHDPARVLE